MGLFEIGILASVIAAVQASQKGGNSAYAPLEDDDYVDRLYSQPRKDESEDELDAIRCEDDELMEELQQKIQDGEISQEYELEEWLDEVETAKCYDMRRLRKRVHKLGSEF